MTKLLNALHVYRPSSVVYWSWSFVLSHWSTWLRTPARAILLSLKRGFSMRPLYRKGGTRANRKPRLTLRSFEVSVPPLAQHQRSDWMIHELFRFVNRSWGPFFSEFCGKRGEQLHL
jgi:hypothetical protein